MKITSFRAKPPRASASSTQSSIGRPMTSTRVFGISEVSCCRRLPRPAPITIARMAAESTSTPRQKFGPELARAGLRPLPVQLAVLHGVDHDGAAAPGPADEEPAAFFHRGAVELVGASAADHPVHVAARRDRELPVVGL